MPQSPSEIGPPHRHRDTLEEVAAALRDLHRALLDEERAGYESRQGPIAGPVQLLQLVTHDPSFAWLRVLSEFMADLDGLLDEADPPSEQEARALGQELEQVLSAAGPAAFWDRCLPLLQVVPVAIAYARLRAALSRLPGKAGPDPAAEIHAGHRWAAARRLRHAR
jgi:hypothetical protein